MKILIVLASITAAILILFKWRYRLFNTLLAISFLRKLAVIISMNMPAIRSKVLPGLFNKQVKS